MQRHHIHHSSAAMPVAEETLHIQAPTRTINGPGSIPLVVVGWHTPQLDCPYSAAPACHAPIGGTVEDPKASPSGPTGAPCPEEGNPERHVS